MRNLMAAAALNNETMNLVMTVIVSFLILVTIVLAIMFFTLRNKRIKEERAQAAARKARLEQEAIAREERTARNEEEERARKAKDKKARLAEVYRNRELKAYYRTPEGKIKKEELDREKLELQKTEAEAKERNRIAANLATLEAKANAKSFFESLDPATVNRVKTASSKRTRENILRAELEAAYRNGTIARGTNESSNILNSILLYSILLAPETTYNNSPKSHDSSNSYYGDHSSSSSSSSSYDHESSSYDHESSSSYDSGSSYGGE
jgi:DNA repair exonuclease SbcCD ATPase subunit